MQVDVHVAQRSAALGQDVKARDLCPRRIGALVKAPGQGDQVDNRQVWGQGVVAGEPNLARDAHNLCGSVSRRLDSQLFKRVGQQVLPRLVGAEDDGLIQRSEGRGRG